MSAEITDTVRRGPGRPARPKTETVAPDAGIIKDIAEPVTETWCGYPVMPDAEMEQYGGDLSMWESWSQKANRPMATWRDAPPISSALPELLSKGMLVNRHAPEQRFHFSYLTEDGSPQYHQAFMTMTRRGYKPAQIGDWYVHSILRTILVPEDGTGRLTLGGALKGGSTVVYYQNKADYDRIKAHERAPSDEIQKTAEQRQAELAERLAKEGLAVTTGASLSDY